MASLNSNHLVCIENLQQFWQAKFLTNFKMVSDLKISTERLLQIILCALDIIIYVPIQCYTTFKCRSFINKNYAKQQKQNGHPHFAMLMNLFGILFTLFVHPLILICTMSQINTSHPSLHAILLTLTHIIAFIIMIGLLLCCLTRYWLIYFDIHFLNSLMHNQWKIYLNSSCIKHDPWFKYRKKWGNTRFVAKFIGIIYVLFCCTHCFVMIFIRYININVLDKLRTALLLLAVIIGSTIYLRMPKLSKSNSNNNEDNPILSSLKYELKAFVFAVLVEVIIGFILLGIFNNHNGMKFQESNQAIQRFLHLGPYALTIVIVCLLTMYSAKCMYRQNSDNINAEQNYRLVRDNTNGSELEMDTQMKFKLVLCNEHEMELFIKYLCKIFELKTILCFIELMQFKHLLDELFDITLNRDRYTLGTILENTSIEYESKENDNYYEQCVLSVICDSEIIPRSEIVYANYDQLHDEQKNETVKECLKIAHKLYNKYIAENDDNIDYDIKEVLIVDISDTLKKCYDLDMEMCLKDFVQNHEDDSCEDLFDYYDPVIEEMYEKLKIMYEDYT